MGAQYYANSDRGRIRSVNQDRYLLHPMGENILLVAVFDGMGGHGDGDLAAERAAERFLQVFSTPPKSEEEGAALLRTAARDADADIRALRAGREDRRGMGTTVTAILLFGRRVLSLNVGDSRTYLHRMGDLFLLTHDDSYVQALVDAGQITQIDAAFHPRRNVITRSLGSLGLGEVKVNVSDACAGDTYLLCSDGLHGMVAESFIGRLLSQQLSLATATGYLIAAANENGGEDNVTVALVRV